MTGRPPLVSVIIPNRNHAKYLRQRIDSVLHQTFQDFELIILDDASTDNSKQIVEGYRDHPRMAHIIYNTMNSGSAFKQWKKGLDLAKGEWIWIAESDDWAELNFLEIAREHVKAYPAAGLFYCDCNFEEEDIHYKFSSSSALKNNKFNTTKWNDAYDNNGIDEFNDA